MIFRSPQRGLCTPGETRTHNLKILSLAPLPRLGYGGKMRSHQRRNAQRVWRESNPLWKILPRGHNPLPRRSESDPVRPRGVEPLTSWSVARCSIQLSYERIMQFSLIAPDNYTSCSSDLSRVQGETISNPTSTNVKPHTTMSIMMAVTAVEVTCYPPSLELAASPTKPQLR